MAALAGFIAEAGGDEFDFFEKKIRPVLAEKCSKCHSASSEKLKGGLFLDSKAGMLKGGESGKAAIVPGQPDESLLLTAISYEDPNLQMPPKERLTSTQIEAFREWIAGGAPDPRTNAAKPSAIVDATKHWAFQPLRWPAAPKVKNTAWGQTPIDAFVLAKLEAAQLAPAPPADRRTFIRRATYDLLGLPPTPAEVEAFLSDRSANAYPALIDRLLASPRYGERWGRYWLDLARYSDTKGYVYDREEKRFVHSHVYRDWVIKAFNDDLPYDKFLKLQIAADYLEKENSPDLAALGFLTIGRRFLGVIHDIIDDRIDVVSRTTMGLSAGCARCHDHKFDPIPTRDYYSLYGVFANTSEKTVQAGTGDIGSPDYPAFEAGLRTRQEKLNSVFQKKRAELTDRLRAKAPAYLDAVLDVAKLPNEEFYTIMSGDDLNPLIVRQWEAYIYKTKGRTDRVFGLWNAYAALKPAEFAAKAGAVQIKEANPLLLSEFASKAPTSMREVAKHYGAVFQKVDSAWRAAVKKGATNDTLSADEKEIYQVLYGPDSPAAVPNGAVVDIEWFFDEGGRVELAKLQAEIDRWLINAPAAPPHAVILSDRSQLKNARVFLRGNPANKGEEVPRRFFEFLSGPNRAPFTNGSGRLEMAEAIAHKDNPLTARVLVNRVWTHHFGAGLVRTPSDFGTRAEPPTHPELLDWLALRFINDGWSIKKLHRLVMLSSVYQQESVAASDPEFEQKKLKDPENRLLSHMPSRRLDFEAMRDSFFAVADELDLAVGGKSVELFKANAKPRRTVYGYIDRQFVPGALRVFDFANPDLHTPQRPDTTVPQQALFFMNNPFVAERARKAVKGIHATGKTQRIEQLYNILFQRKPSKAELEAGLEFVDATPDQPAPEPPKPPPSPWRYGYAYWNEAAKTLTGFTPLPHFTGEAWQGGANWPDATLGWVQLTAEGGHAGNDVHHAAVRRWIAPENGAVSIVGNVRHEEAVGDGIRAHVLLNGTNVLGSWTLHNKRQEFSFEKTAVQPGDTIDLVVDLNQGLNSDMFKCSQTIKYASSAPALAEWNARKDFSGPAQPRKPLDAWEKYAQVLMLSNEFMFVD